jgi:hypothetical protein
VLTFKNPSVRLDYEIGQERASALGRQGRRLEAALAALRAYDAAHPQRPPCRSDQGRVRLVADAGEAFWYLIVQRDACGLYGNAALVADYGVPAEVVNCAGPSPYKDATPTRVRLRVR